MTLTTYRSPNGQTFQIHPDAVPVVEPFFHRLNQVYPGYQSAGGYAHRPMRTLDGRNLGGLSTHATGYTLDVKAPDPVLRQMAQEFPHLKWGGKFSHYDPVHFEFGPTAQKYGELPPLNPASLLDPNAAAPTPGPQPPAIAPSGGAAPMTPMQPMTPYSGPSPDDVAQQRRMAQMLMQQATSTEPVGHWTQALARVVQGGVGGMYRNAAQEGEQQGRESVAQLLSGNPTPQALYSNPYTREMGQQLWLAQAKSKLPGEAPSNIREWEYFQKLPPEAQSRYLNMKRADKYLDTGTEFVRPNPANPAGPPIQSIPKDIEGREAAEKRGQARGTAQADLGRVIANAEQALDTLDQIRKHPGKQVGTGVLGVVPPIPGTEQAGFVDLVEQAKGKAFLEAFNSLKGGGQITEAEGRKATEALARLQRARRQEDFDKALDDFEAVVRAGAMRAYRAAGQQPQVITPPAPTGSVAAAPVAPRASAPARSPASAPPPPGVYEWTPQGLQPVQGGSAPSAATQPAAPIPTPPPALRPQGSALGARPAGTPQTELPQYAAPRRMTPAEAELLRQQGLNQFGMPIGGLR